MGASVRVESSALSDLRFEELGALLGTSRYDALGRMTYLWSYCTDKGKYVLSEALIRTIVDPEWLVACDLGERVDGGIRIKGTEGRIEWLSERREAAIRGGEATKAKWEAKGRPQGPTLARPNGLHLARPQARPNDRPKGGPPAPAPTTALDLDPNAQLDASASDPTHSEKGSTRISLNEFVSQVAEAGIAISPSMSDRERFSRLFPVEQFEIDHAIERGVASRSTKFGYVLSVIEGERQKAANAKPMPSAQSPPKNGLRDSVIAEIERIKLEDKRRKENAGGQGAQRAGG